MHCVAESKKKTFRVVSAPPPQRVRRPRQVPSFALVAAALSSFPSRRLASDSSSSDPCAERLPALANSTLASLVRCGFPFNVGGGGGGLSTGPPMAGSPAGSASAGIGPVPRWLAGSGGGGCEVVKPLADSLSPGDAYHLRRALVAAVSAASAEGGGSAAVIEERRAAALDLLLSAVREQPALVVVLFWAQPSPSSGGAAASAKGRVDGGEEAAGGPVVVVGDAALSGAVLSALKALSVELADGQNGLAGGEEALVMALELVLALWCAEGVGRLGQVLYFILFYFISFHFYFILFYYCLLLY